MSSPDLCNGEANEEELITGIESDGTNSRVCKFRLIASIIAYSAMCFCHHFQMKGNQGLLFAKPIVHVVLPVDYLLLLGGLGAAFIWDETYMTKGIILVLVMVFSLYSTVTLLVIYAAARHPSLIGIATWMVLLLIEYIVPFCCLLLHIFGNIPIIIVCIAGFVLAVAIFIFWCLSIKRPTDTTDAWQQLVGKEPMDEPSSLGTVEVDEDTASAAKQKLAGEEPIHVLVDGALGEAEKKRKLHHDLYPASVS